MLSMSSLLSPFGGVNCGDVRFVCIRPDKNIMVAIKGFLVPAPFRAFNYDRYEI